MMPETKATPEGTVDSDTWNVYVPLDIVTKDPYGRRSRAWRHQASNMIFSETELMEDNVTYKPELNFFRRQDKLRCFMISTVGRFRDGLMKKFLVFLCFPFMMTYLGYTLVMACWDKWRMGPPESS